MSERDWEVNPPTRREVRQWREGIRKMIARGLHVSLTGEGYAEVSRMGEAEDRYEAIDKAIEACRLSGEREVVSVRKGRGEAYAYKHERGIAWGVNGKDGQNVLCGIRRPDDIDEGVS